jgi:hypothetical protein
MSASTKLAAPEQFEVEHRPSRMLDSAMVLPDDVVEVFNLTHKDRHFAAGVDRIDRSLVGPALVHRDLSQITVRSHGLVKKTLRCGHVALCRQQRVDGLSLLVDSAVEVFPDPLGLDVRLIPAPAAVDRALPFLRHPLSSAEKKSPSGLWMNGQLTHRALP